MSVEEYHIISKPLCKGGDRQVVPGECARLSQGDPRPRAGD